MFERRLKTSAEKAGEMTVRPGNFTTLDFKRHQKCSVETDPEPAKGYYGDIVGHGKLEFNDLYWLVNFW